MTSIPIQVTKADFDTTRGGWRVPVLGIPGATLTAMYVGGEEVTPSAYRVGTDGAFVQWTKDSPPADSATFAVDISPNKLSRKSDTVIWQSMTAVATAIIAALGLIISSRQPKSSDKTAGAKATDTKPAARAWTIRGKLALPPNVDIGEIYGVLRPPDLRLLEDTTFSATIHLAPDQVNPSLVFVVVKPPKLAAATGCAAEAEYATAMVTLYEPGTSPLTPYGASAYTLDFDTANHMMAVHQPIVITPMPKCPQNPQQATPTAAAPTSNPG